MIYIYQLAKFNKAANHQVLMILREFIFDSVGILMAKEASTSVEKAGWISGGKPQFKVALKEQQRQEHKLLMMQCKPARKTSAQEVAKPEWSIIC